MARDIPGYYFDAEKGKYFKVQPNHAVSSAAKYSKQAVEAQRATAKRRRLDDQAQTRRLRETTQRSALLQDPFHRLWLRTALDGTVARPNVTTEVAAYYGASLSRSTLIDRSPGLFHKFVVDDVTGAMITASTGVSRSQRPGGPWVGHHFVHHWPHSRIQSRVISPYTGIRYGIMPPEEVVSALLITPRPLNCIMWATSASGLHSGTLSVVPVDQSLEGAGEDFRGPEGSSNDQVHQVQQWASDIEMTYTGDVGLTYNLSECDIWALASSPSGQRVVVGSSRGLFVFTTELPGAQPHQRWQPSKMDHRSTDAEFMAVAFKDEHVVFAGTRSGAVHIADLREKNLAGTTTRLRHPSGVTALRALSNDNYVVVRGLETMSIYDLRYTPMAKSLSKPYMTFRGGPSYASDRFGLGFDYDPGLALIATAHSSPLPSHTGPSYDHHISLFSTRTGALVPSPINTHAFPAPVTCIQFTNAVRARSNNAYSSSVFDGVSSVSDNVSAFGSDNEPKSIVTASGGLIDEWTVQGLGREDGRQE